MKEIELVSPISILTLYGREHCHLCELAQAILHAAQLSAHVIDIDSDPELGARYGLRIPVLVYPDGRELDWPFSQDDLPSVALELVASNAHS